MIAAQPQAGPSKPRQKTKKNAQKLVKTAKARRSNEKQKVEALENAAMNYVPDTEAKLFSELPISDLTKRGLKKAFFVNMTDIQAKSLPVSLKGRDVLGAARTGSGKTLAFLIPVLEMLYRKRWSAMDGLGALIISPTRELAVQIFEVLRSIGGLHSFSAGLVIGGKNLKDESERLTRMNILVATPGRLLQHMDQTVGFAADNLQMLVLDEADRILDMGFAKTLSALLKHLPKSRQTLLFSATQTQSVHDLARLSLSDPASIGIEETTLSSIPSNLEQHYIRCDLDKKLDILWSFIKSHLQSKTLVFLSSCKQVRFVFETFCKMHPGIPLICLHGKQKQMQRLSMYTKFTESQHAVLFATDIAARGLDFPAVDWVVQVDAPEDAETYIHRVGRTARYESGGKGLLVLLPSEVEGMLARLKEKNIEPKNIKVKASKTQSIQNQLQKLAFQEPEIKYLGQRAFVSYLRSIYLHKDKTIFKLDQLPVEKFAESLGLPGAPKIKFLNKEIAKQKKNASRLAEEAKKAAEEEIDGEEEDDSGEEESEEEKEEVQPAKAAKNGVRTKYDRMFERKNQGILSEHYSKLIDHEGSGGDESEDDFITLKRADHNLSDDSDVDERDQELFQENVSKRKQKLGKAKRTIKEQGGQAKKLIFDDEGQAHELYEGRDAEEWYKEKGGLEGAMGEGKKFAEGEREKMQVSNVLDKEEAREKKREKKRKRKEREGGKTMDDEDMGPSLMAFDEDVDDGYVSPEFDLPSESEEDTAPPPSKRLRPDDGDRHQKPRNAPRTMEDDEELALRLLRGS